MKLALVIKPNDLACTYGNIPNVPNESNAAAEVFHFVLDSGLSFDEFYWRIVDPINSLCGTLLDDGDVDYIESEACVVLLDWAKGLLQEAEDRWLREWLLKLIEFATRAVDLGTGLVVEL